MELSPAARLRGHIRGLWRTGLVAIAVCFGGFGTWAAVAPLASASIASGKVSPDSSRKTVQHLEGGILKDILVHEGDFVRAGQVLVRLEPTQAAADFDARREEWARLMVVRARLLAEAAGRSEFRVPPQVDGASSDDFRAFLDVQNRSFEIGQNLVQEKKDIFQRQIDQLEEESQSIDAQNKGLTEQLAILQQEIQQKTELKAKGLVRLPELYELQRMASETTAQIEGNKASISRLAHSVEEKRLSIHSVDSEYLDKVTEELTEVNGKIAQLVEAMQATQDVLDRTEIVAPVDGKILNVHFKTLGGVVRPGEPILDVVPTDDDLTIDAKLSPIDIDNVAIGMDAQVQISSFMTRHMPLLPGTVVEVGADALTDPDTHQQYYPLKVKVELEQTGKVSKEIELLPGMPADVFIATGLHTPLEYFMEPILRSFDRAFREEVI